MSAADGLVGRQPGPRGESALAQLVSIVHPWRWQLVLVAGLVLLGALLELVPPLVMRRIVDENLTPGTTSGLLPLALLYLGATAAGQAAGALGIYLASSAAQGALHAMRVRLFSH